MSIHSTYRKWTRPLRHRLRGFRIPRWLSFDYLARILTYPIVAPITWFVSTWRARTLRSLLLGLPAVIGFLAVAMWYASARTSAAKATDDYWREAQRAYASDDYGRTEFLLGRILSSGESRRNDALLLYAYTLEKTDRLAAAEDVFASLAPDDAIGHRDAHRRLAILLAAQLTPESPPDQLSRCRWHLNAANDQRSPEMALSWATYLENLLIRKGYRPSDVEQYRPDVDRIIGLLKVASEKRPEAWSRLGRYYQLLNQQVQSQTSYAKASAYFRQQLEQSPDDVAARVNLVDALAQLGEYDEARRVLQEAERDGVEGPWKKLLSNLFVLLHDVAVARGSRDMGDTLGLLSRALAYEPNNPAALRRLMAYSQANVRGSERNIKLREVLQRVVAEGKEPAMANLALGNLWFLEGDRQKAAEYFERALAIREDLAVVANNLAVILLEDGDLERALFYATRAAEERPNSAEFHDTCGKILVRMKQWDQAIAEFQKAQGLVPPVKDVEGLHRQLAICYRALNDEDMARQHERLADEVKARRAGAAAGDTPIE